MKKKYNSAVHFNIHTVLVLEIKYLSTFNHSFFESRKEHISHSPSCHFIALKKKVYELTLEEFARLQKERHKFIIVCTSGDSISLKLLTRTTLNTDKMLCSCENKGLWHLS